MRVLILAAGLALATPALADAPEDEAGRWLAEGAFVSAGSLATPPTQKARVIPRPYVQPARPAPSATRRSGAWPGSPPVAAQEPRGALWPETR